MNWSEGERILILGGSRGLGAALADQIRNVGLEVICISRKSPISADFANSGLWLEVFQKIKDMNPTRIIYCAAGGPYGPFGQFEWKDHSWALKVTFEFPAALLHFISKNPISSLKQFLVIGSLIAESQPDPGAASYAAAKHAIKGLVTSLQKEPITFDLRLLSPGYMSTGLLPFDSAPRREGKARDPHIIAAQMIQSISNPALRLQNQAFD